MSYDVSREQEFDERIKNLLEVIQFQTLEDSRRGIMKNFLDRILELLLSAVFCDMLSLVVHEM